jgi:hypothetical protein
MTSLSISLTPVLNPGSKLSHPVKQPIVKLILDGINVQIVRFKKLVGIRVIVPIITEHQIGSLQ